MLCKEFFFRKNGVEIAKILLRMQESYSVSGVAFTIR